MRRHTLILVNSDKVVPLLQFFFESASVVSYVAFVLSVCSSSPSFGALGILYVVVV